MHALFPHAVRVRIPTQVYRSKYAHIMPGIGVRGVGFEPATLWNCHLQIPIFLLFVGVVTRL